MLRVIVANATKWMSKLTYNPSDSIIFLTNRVGRLLASHIRFQNESEEYARMLPHIGILVDLWEKDGVRQQDLAISLIKDKGTIARALTAMETMTWSFAFLTSKTSATSVFI